jgi:hypothetical protein
MEDVVERLRPLLGEWGTLGDVERADRLRDADEETLAALWRDVSPHLEAIDRVIAAHAGPLPDDAVRLGTLAAAAQEARAELRLRGLER